MTEVFEREYSADGVWARLFRKSPDYRGTALLRDPESGGAYVVIDVWNAKAAYDGFRIQYAAEYAAIDARCKALIEDEARLGIFEVLGPASEPSIFK